jgi:hypothetical protein
MSLARGEREGSGGIYGGVWLAVGARVHVGLRIGWRRRCRARAGHLPEVGDGLTGGPHLSVSERGGGGNDLGRGVLLGRAGFGAWAESAPPALFSFFLIFFFFSI